MLVQTRELSCSDLRAARAILQLIVLNLPGSEWQTADTGVYIVTTVWLKLHHGSYISVAQHEHAHEFKFS